MGVNKNAFATVRINQNSVVAQFVEYIYMLKN